MSTLEHALDLLAAGEAATVRIEGAEGPDGVDDVDFDVVNADGRCLTSAQIKTSSAAGGVAVGLAFDVLIQLISKVDAEAYLLRYQAAPRPEAQAFARLLSSNPPIPRLRQELEEILANSPARLTQLRNLQPDDLLGRLGRARLEFDLRDSHEILGELRERLRTHRNTAQTGLGEHSAGILAGFLVAEIMRRAVDGPAELSASHLAALVLTPGDQLAAIHGARDWGAVVGPMPAVPDIPRPAVMKAMTSAAAGGRGVNRLELCGLSGIGKSSMAAAYIADRADLYDWIIWIDAQSEAALRSGFESVAIQLCGLTPGQTHEFDNAQLRARVHTELSRSPGRWLLVYDDVRDHRATAPWLPAAGNGDIIVTSVDATARTAQATRITVPEMDSTECEQMLAARLELPDGIDAQVRHTIQRLGEALGRWPLALSLAAGYMNACGLGLSDTETYLRSLKLRSLDDDRAVPAGYPQTLTAVVRTSLQAILDRSEASPAPHLAVGMLACTAFLGPRRIPTQLVAASVALDASLSTTSSLDLLGPLLLDMGSFPVPEAVRELRRFSLVSIDEPLPESANSITEGQNQTLAVNSIIQDLLRADTAWTHPKLINNLAAHTGRWQTAAVGRGDMATASIVFTHAAALAEHLLTMDLRSPEVAYLYGNLARSYRYTDDEATAERLILAELDIVSDPACAYGALPEQTHLAVASMYLTRPDRSTLDLDTAIASLQQVYTAAARHAADVPRAATSLALQALGFISAYRHGGHPVTPPLEDLERAFQQLYATLPSSPWGIDHERFQQAEILVNTGQPAEAEALLRQILDSGYLDGSEHTHIRLRLVDALSQQGRLAETLQGLRKLRDRLQGDFLPTTMIAHTIYNVALQASMHWLVDARVEGALVLDELFDWAIAERAGEFLEPWRAHHFETIRAFHLASQGRVTEAGTALEMLERLESTPAFQDRVSARSDTWSEAKGILLDVARRIAAAQPDPALALDRMPTNDNRTSAWGSADYRRHRRASIEFAAVGTTIDPEAMFARFIASLAIYLEAGVDQNPALDLAYTLKFALDGFGIKAEPWTTTLSAQDTESGSKHVLGSDTPRWRPDGTFTGHCVLLVPAQGRLFDLTVDQLPAIRHRYKGPLAARAEIRWPGMSHSTPLDYAGRTLTFPREAVNLTYHFAEASDNRVIAADNEHIRRRLSAYKRAGRHLTAAALRIQRV